MAPPPVGAGAFHLAHSCVSSLAKQSFHVSYFFPESKRRRQSELASNGFPSAVCAACPFFLRRAVVIIKWKNPRQKAGRAPQRRSRPAPRTRARGALGRGAMSHDATEVGGKDKTWGKAGAAACVPCRSSSSGEHASTKRAQEENTKTHHDDSNMTHAKIVISEKPLCVAKPPYLSCVVLLLSVVLHRCRSGSGLAVLRRVRLLQRLDERVA